MTTRPTAGNDATDGHFAHREERPIMSDGTTDAEQRRPDGGDNATEQPLVEVVHATGHEHVTAEHPSTIEFTTDDWLTPAGDCIVGVDADSAPRSFSSAFRAACQDAEATITATIAVGEPPDANADPADVATAPTPDPATAPYVETIQGRGDPGLALVDDRSMVGRTSDYTDDERTIFVAGDGAAADLDRDLVEALSAGAPVTLRLVVTENSRRKPRPSGRG